MVAVVCLIRPERLDALLEAAFGVVERHIGVVNVTDARSAGGAVLIRRSGAGAAGQCCAAGVPGCRGPGD
jgi:hypothetical protein